MRLPEYSQSTLLRELVLDHLTILLFCLLIDSYSEHALYIYYNPHLIYDLFILHKHTYESKNFCYY